MAHQDLLAHLLPPVSYNPNAPRLGNSLAVEGAEFDRVLADAVIALGALRPFAFQYWLDDWERVYGLPAECVDAGQLLQERLQLLALAFAERGGISIAWLKRYATLAGYAVDIAEYSPFRAGISSAGDPLSNGVWRHAFLVTALGEPERPFSSGQSCAGDALRLWGAGNLECIINKYKPAHTVALFAYMEA